MTSDEPIPLRRSVRERKPNPRYPNNVNISCQFALLVSDPGCYEEAAKQFEWRTVMVQEIQAIKKNSTWELVDSPEGRNVIGLKLVFRTKCKMQMVELKSIKPVSWKKDIHTNKL